ncbi:hypothetical protein BN946_scf184747.g40 [Trametes cinnabarina]|uniref:Uncharacterized protein n=1 Tax=Pycnoporus cinnabarinus TaxID=5643 RepID=A0A060SRR0_PYCCI|nr:hypothetical protein BN946_scf184747.g40 [Trametes cinnabarina]
MFGRWSSNPEANYVMIEPNLKYMLYTAQARANPPLPWYERPPPTPKKPIPVDKIRFLPSRRLDNAFESSPWRQTVADDLDSFTHVMLHAFLFRGKKRRDGSTDSIAYAYNALNKEHPKILLNWRDDVEDSILALGKKVKQARAEGKEPDGGSIDAIAEQLYEVIRVNIRHHSWERELANGYRTREEGAEERWKKQYEQYNGAMEELAKAADEATRRKEEARRLKAEQKALKAQQAAEEANQKAEALAGEASQAPTDQDVEQATQIVEGQERGGETSVVDTTSLEFQGKNTSKRESLDEPAAKRPRLE